MRVWPGKEVRDAIRAEGALKTVWDNIDLAELFIAKAVAADKGKGDLPLRWCISIAANGV